MKIFSIDVRVVATAYIKAETEEEAMKIAEGLRDEGIEFGDRYQSVGYDVCVDGSPYSELADNDETVALSPAMTLYGPADGATIEYVEDLDEDEDESE